METVLFTQNPNGYPNPPATCHIVTEPQTLHEFVRNSRPAFILMDRSSDFPQSIVPTNQREPDGYCPTVIFATQPILLQFLSLDYLSEAEPPIRDIPSPLSKAFNSALLRFSFSPSLKGYRYIKQALYYQYVNTHEISAVKKDIYESASSCYKTSVYSVERGIAFAIKKAYAENPHPFRDLFPNLKKPPSNMAFLKTFFIYLEQEGYL